MSDVADHYISPCKTEIMSCSTGKEQIFICLHVNRSVRSRPGLELPLHNISRGSS